MNVEISIVTTTLNVPVATASRPGHIQRNPGNMRLTRPQAEALHSLKSGLVALDAKLDNGRAVETAESVLRWLLEEVARKRDEQSAA